MGEINNHDRDYTMLFATITTTTCKLSATSSLKSSGTNLRLDAVSTHTLSSSPSFRHSLVYPLPLPLTHQLIVEFTSFVANKREED